VKLWNAEKATRITALTGEKKFDLATMCA
jgi:hypothetical protein